MKQIIVTLLMAACAIAMPVKAQVELNTTHFPDANFRAALAKEFDISDGGIISASQIAETTSLYIVDESIADLKGIEFFTALEYLYCHHNQLTSLDVSKNTKLLLLQCSYNQLNTLDVSKNTDLCVLYCNDNQLTTIDISKNRHLYQLNCSFNQLTALDVSQNLIETLYCYGNQIGRTAMDILVNGLMDLSEVESVNGTFYVNNGVYERNECTTEHVAIAQQKGWTVLDSGGKPYAGIDPNIKPVTLNAQNFPDANFRAALAEHFFIDEGDELSSSQLTTTYLTLSNKSIKDLKGIEYFPNLEDLYCPNNQLTSLNVSKNTALESLSCNFNQLTVLDVSNNTSLQSLYCDNNHLTTLDVSNNTALELLSCHNNQLTVLDVSNNTAMEYLSCGDNQLTELDVSKNSALERLYCYNNMLTSLYLPETSTLYLLSCFENQLTSLDVTQNTGLLYLYCYGNELASLDVTKNKALVILGCSDNLLTSLDVTQNVALQQLDCGDNQLTALDVSQNTALTKLWCFWNKLPYIILTNNKSLEVLDCSDNLMKALYLAENKAIKEVWCENNQINGVTMDNLVNYLPTVNEGALYIIDTKSRDEGNVCTKSQVLIAKGKGWTVYDYNGGGGLNEDDFPEYEGSDSTGIKAITTNADGNTKTTYNVNGQRVGESYRGIAIRNGRKVIIK